MKPLLSIIYLILFPITIAIGAVPYSQWWTKANNFYSQKSYDSAVLYYEKIAAEHPANAEVDYNLGNTYYRLNRVGLSILNYKRAIKFKPNYKEAEDNLQLAQSRMSKQVVAQNDVFFIKWWKSITSPSLSRTWAVVSLVLFLLLIGFLFWSRWRKSMSFLQQNFLYAGLLLMAFTLVAAYVSAQNKFSRSEAVVLSSDAIFKTEMKSTKSENLPEGTILKCEKEIQSGWVSVELSDGRKGWISEESIEKI